MIVFFTAASAQVAIGPFTGSLQEGFEDEALTGAAPPCIDVFDELGTLCAPDASVGGIQVRDTLFLSCLLEARGTRMAGSNDGPAELLLPGASSRVGAWFATHADAGDLTITLLRADGSVLLEDTAAFANTCSWQWRGWESLQEPIWGLRIAHSEHLGALVDVDDIEVELACSLDDLDCDGAPSATDCDDRDPARAPGALELCDGLDNDCDGALIPGEDIDLDGDGALSCADCDDGDPSVHPGAIEICDGLDNDCSGQPDDALQAPLATLQEGVCAGAVQICDGTAFVDDFSGLAGFEATEQSCDGLDNDCNGHVDDVDAPQVRDGRGVCAGLFQICDGGMWTDPSPGPDFETEEQSCDGLDNDCDGTTDEALLGPASDPNGACPGTNQICVDGEFVEPTEVDCVKTSVCGCGTHRSPLSGLPLSGLLWLLALPLLASRRRRPPEKE